MLGVRGKRILIPPFDGMEALCVSAYQCWIYILFGGRDVVYVVSSGGEGSGV